MKKVQATDVKTGSTEKNVHHKKRKRLKNGHCVETKKLCAEVEKEHLVISFGKKLKIHNKNSGSGTKVRLQSDCEQTHFMKHKKKVMNCYKINGPGVGEKVEKKKESFPGSNDLEGMSGKQPADSKEEYLTINKETNNLLRKIERQGMCSNWKLFKEIIRKDDSSAATKFKRKKAQKLALKSQICYNDKNNTKLGDKTAASQKTVVALESGKQVLGYGQVNGNSKQEKKVGNTIKRLSEFKKCTSNELQCKNLKKGTDAKNTEQHGTSYSSTKNNLNRLTKEIALDCEMVGTDDGSDLVARVSLVNKFGDCVYDKYVAPTEQVLDYRTWVSGIRPENLENAEDFKVVQKEVADLLHGRLLVGHAIQNDLKVLYLSHPRRYTRDTQRFKLFRELAKTKRPSLKKLASTVLNISIQEGEHSSVEDAKVAMHLYMMYRKKWENLLKASRRKHDTKSLIVTVE